MGASSDHMTFQTITWNSFCVGFFQWISAVLWASKDSILLGMLSGKCHITAWSPHFLCCMILQLWESLSSKQSMSSSNVSNGLLTKMCYFYTYRCQAKHRALFLFLSQGTRTCQTLVFMWKVRWFLPHISKLCNSLVKKIKTESYILRVTKQKELILSPLILIIH